MRDNVMKKNNKKNREKKKDISQWYQTRQQMTLI